MKWIEVLAPGLLTTVQDLGREGFGPLGVSASGAADAVALRIGNRLVGNDEGAAALEMTLLGGTFHFPDGGVMALAGSDFCAKLDDMPVAGWTSVALKPRQTLSVGATKSGARCYLCVEGGVEVPRVMGSGSTHLLSGLGGLGGRALRKGDVLQVAAPKQAFRTFRKRTVNRQALEQLKPRKTLRVTAGPQSNWFSEEAQRAFYGSAFRVTEESNRMGIRLEGTPLKGTETGEMISEGVSLGAIQITAGGLPIILFVEQQTTGGYPKIANVIAADVHSVGQLRPRDEIHFERIAMDAAQARLADLERLLRAKELIVE